MLHYTHTYTNIHSFVCSPIFIIHIDTHSHHNKPDWHTYRLWNVRACVVASHHIISSSHTPDVSNNKQHHINYKQHHNKTSLLTIQTNIHLKHKHTYSIHIFYIHACLYSITLILTFYH